MYLLLVGEGLPAAFTVALDLVERPPWGGFEWQGGLRGAQRSAGHFVGLSREQTIIRKAGGGQIGIHYSTIVFYTALLNT